MTLSPIPAHAGSWQFSCGPGSSGQATLQITDFFGVHPTQTTKWVSPSSANQPTQPTNSLTLPGVSSGAGTSSDAAGSAVWTEDANVTAVITAIWTHGMGQTDVNDPAPSSVWLIETSSAGWSAEGSGSGAPVPGTGSASDGLSNPTDIPVISYDSNGLKNGESYNSKNAPVTTPPAHWFVQPVSDGTFTFTRTFKAHCVGKLPASATGGGIINMTCGFGGYTVKIHAQPYGWYDAGYDSDLTGGKDNSGGPKIDDPNGTMTFRYKWHSTDGNLSHLRSIVMYEYVDYTGNPGTFPVKNNHTYYDPPSPPIGLDLSHESPQAFEIGNPEISVIDATIGATYDGHSAWPTQTPLSKLMVVAPQMYEFNDDATGETSIVLFDCGTITDGIHVNPNSFYIRKGGYYMEKPL